MQQMIITLFVVDYVTAIACREITYVKYTNSHHNRCNKMNIDASLLVVSLTRICFWYVT